MVVEIGPQYPLHSGASSRSILAYLPPDFIDEAVRDLRQLAQPTSTWTTSSPSSRRCARSVTRRPSTSGAPAPPRSRRPSSTLAATCSGSVSSSGLASRYSADVDERHQPTRRRSSPPPSGSPSCCRGPAVTPRLARLALPRSFLYVPGRGPTSSTRPRGGEADAIVLDLEDAVPLPAKDEARDAGAALARTSTPARGAVRTTRGSRVSRRVRRRGPARRQCTRPSAGLFVAKASSEVMAEVDAELTRLEAYRGVAPAGA